MRLQELGHRQRVFRVPLHAQVQGLRALQQQEGVEGRQRGAGIAQALHARLDDEGQRPECLGVGDAVVGRIGIDEIGEAAGGFPVELAAIDDDAANGGAVPANELGGRVDDDVRAPLDGPGTGRAMREVLSMTSGTPCSCAISASFSMSATSSLGLPSVSV